jgi:hypothetical protein
MPRVPKHRDDMGYGPDLFCQTGLCHQQGCSFLKKSYVFRYSGSAFALLLSGMTFEMNSPA